MFPFGIDHTCGPELHTSYAHGFIRWLREYRYGGNTANEVKTKKIDEEVMTSFIVEIRVVHHVYYKMRRKIKQMNGK